MKKESRELIWHAIGMLHGLSYINDKNVCTAILDVADELESVMEKEEQFDNECCKQE